MNKAQAILEMNKRGKGQEPFFFIINYKMDLVHVYSPKDAAKEGIYFNFKDQLNNCSELSSSPQNIKLSKSPISLNQYTKAFNQVQDYLHKGYSYLVNLTAQSDIETPSTLQEIFFNAKAKYKILFKNDFTVYSPETFVKIIDGKIFTYPMKGTIDAATPDAKNNLLNNKKELAEHATIVDLLRNDLSTIAQNVTVEKFRYIEKVNSLDKTLLQVSSKISGNLPPDYKNHLGEIIFKMLPAGSITGAPKKKTLEIIEKTENYNRGFYTGIAGYFDGNNLDSCVLIRYIENINGKLVYKSGGGVTTQSNVEEEYRELIDKIYVPTH